MTNGQSKFLPITVTCQQYVHPWTDSCWNSSAGLILHSFEHSARIYTAVYLLSLLMRGRIPTLNDLQRTFFGILQSTGFLVTNGFSYLLYACWIRNILGQFYYYTVAFTPAFLASLTAIMVERPTRRPLLSLYVANLATETLWRMAESRGLVKSIPYGQTIIFGLSTSFLLYIYRLGLHKTIAKDSLFNILKFVIGNEEEGKINKLNLLNEFNDNNEEILQSNDELLQNDNSINRRNINNYQNISIFIKIYTKFINYIKTMPKHKSCPHKNSCTYYSINGGLKLFTIGFGLQVALKFALQIKKIFQIKLKFRKTFFNIGTFKLGLFLGGFSFLYKSLSCFLRHFSGTDHPMHAIPAGFVASFAFTQYPDVTIALYAMWKMLQIFYTIGVSKGLLPKIPGFPVLLFCASTATLFHAAALEPQNLRPSYWKFLTSNSGGRVVHMDRRWFECYGLNSHKNLLDVLKKTNTENSPIKYILS